MSDAPKLLLDHHLKTLKLPTFLREYGKLARQCATEGQDHVQFLARLVELELIDRERRTIERRIKAAKFPTTKSLDSFDFKANHRRRSRHSRRSRCADLRVWAASRPAVALSARPGVPRCLRCPRHGRARRCRRASSASCAAADRMSCEISMGGRYWSQRPRPSFSSVSPCQTASAPPAAQTAHPSPRNLPKGLALSVQDHIALGLGLAACQKGLSVGFTTAAALVHELMEARDERRLLRLQKQMANQKLLIIDELGFVPLSKTGAELLFELISQRYERGSTLITSNLPFDEWTEVFGSERLTGALLDRLTHHVNILEMNGESYRLNQSRSRAAKADA